MNTSHANHRLLVIVSLVIILILSFSLANAQEGKLKIPAPAWPEAPIANTGTGFTYQGRLTDGGAEANGFYDFRFRLFDALTGGAQAGSTLTLGDQTVTNGLFTVSLDFGAVFNGTALWLEVAVRPGASASAYTALAPRQALTATPYALSLAPGATIVGALDTDPLLYINNTNGQGLRVYATSQTDAVSGYNFATTGGVGVYGRSDSTTGIGIKGYASSITGNNKGVFGETDSSVGAGVYGKNSASNGAGAGVYGTADAEFGIGVSGAAGIGVEGTSNDERGIGVRGYAVSSSGHNIGVYGVAFSTEGVGVYGEACAASGPTYGVLGVTDSPTGTAIYGNATEYAGINYGVSGHSPSTKGTGVYGYTSAETGPAWGVYGRTDSSTGIGMYGYAAATSGVNYGVYGKTDSDQGYAAYFNGNVHVSGNLTKSSGAFMIDHPLDPENMYLYHSFVESPDMMNIYNGNVILDANGEAWVSLPDYFEALNMDFRYQLTCIGGFAPVYIAEKIAVNRFKIAGGSPGLEVSWQVTGIRHDPYAEDNRIPVEESKPEDERGTYLYPEGYNMPPELGLDAQRNANFGLDRIR